MFGEACEEDMLHRNCAGFKLGPMSSTRLKVYIQPRASKSEVAGMHDGILKIRVAAPAVDNAANEALVEFVAEALGVAKRSVQIVAGTASRRKVLEIAGVTDDAIAQKLR